VTPAHREGVRRFLGRFAGQELEVALEATTGWRFVVEELRRVGAVVHLAEPAQTSALRGNKKRAKTDRADAKHLRELLMIGRLPESWIPPDHLLDLRSKVRLRHTLVDSAASGSSASVRCSTTTGYLTAPSSICSAAKAATGWGRSTSRTRHASRSWLRSR
jgi:transposase